MDLKAHAVSLGFVAALILMRQSLVGAGLPVNASLNDEEIVVTVGGELFTAYKFSSKQKYPYFWPVNGPSSHTSVTTESSEPYPHHHSLFFGCDRVNGGNYWQEANDRGQILSQGPRIEEGAGERVSFSDECLWRQPGQEPVLRDVRRVVIAAPLPELRFVDFDITLEALTDIRIEQTNHSLFSVRVVPEISVQSGGVLVNAEGQKGEKETFGVASAWCDYAGARQGVWEGIALLQNPGNPWFPCRWFTRDYGFMSPTPMYWPEEGATEIPKSGKIRLQYRVVVHAGDSSCIPGLYESYVQGR